MNLQMNPESSPFAFESFPSVPGLHAAEWPSRLALISFFALDIFTGQEEVSDWFHFGRPNISSGLRQRIRSISTPWSASTCKCFGWYLESL